MAETNDILVLRYNSKAAVKLCRACARALNRLGDANGTAQTSVVDVRKPFLERADELPADSRQRVRITVSLLCDLRAQNWLFRNGRGGIRIIRPAVNDDPETDKQRVRNGHLVERDEQLRKPAVRRFVREMERRRLAANKWISVFSLMRDGRDLADRLQVAAQLPETERVVAIGATIDPYVQVVDSDAVCEHTGFRLLDVWRYFRHTWVSTYNTVPGRTMMVLIRDRAAECHPVIGIAALVSPVVHMTNRDEWIGWAPRQFVKAMMKKPTQAWARWVARSLDGLIREIYINDLVSEKVLARSDLKKPTQRLINRLMEISQENKEQHKLYPLQRLHKNPATSTAANWEERANSFLFRSKRTKALAELLATRLRLQGVGFASPTLPALVQALATAGGRQAVETIRKYVKAKHAGNDMLDVAVCGAIAPYNAILGGKLVAMLMTSPEIVAAYKRRYGRTPSIIASSVAGRPVYREPQLVLLTTTSLYGSALSQYTRIQIPAREVGGLSDDSVKYVDLGRTAGKGSYHLSAATVNEIELYLSQLAEGHRVHSIFGEGVNPRMRKIRSGLDACGFPTEYVLEHGSPRVIYSVALAKNFKRVLIGRCRKPKYILPEDDPAATTAKIADYWTRRWLCRRIGKSEMIASVRMHTLASPIEHGAKVVLPPLESEGPLLFGKDGQPG